MRTLVNFYEAIRRRQKWFFSTPKDVNLRGHIRPIRAFGHEKDMSFKSFSKGKTKKKSKSEKNNFPKKKNFFFCLKIIFKWFFLLFCAKKIFSIFWSWWNLPWDFWIFLPLENPLKLLSVVLLLSPTWSSAPHVAWCIFKTKTGWDPKLYQHLTLTGVSKYINGHV